MSLNLQNGVEAARKLHLIGGDTAAMFGALREALLEQTRKAMNLALECSHEARADAIGYARALRDVYHALEAAAGAVPFQRVDKPGPVDPAAPAPVAPGGKR